MHEAALMGSRRVISQLCICNILAVGEVPNCLLFVFVGQLVINFQSVDLKIFKSKTIVRFENCPQLSGSSKFRDVTLLMALTLGAKCIQRGGHYNIGITSLIRRSAPCSASFRSSPRRRRHRRRRRRRRRCRLWPPPAQRRRGQTVSPE
jgi:hypothetical protein